jgi:hypothetical protein
MKFSKLVEHVSKKPIPPHTKHLLVEVMLMDDEMEDVEVCIRATIRASPLMVFCRCLSSLSRFERSRSSTICILRRPSSEWIHLLHDGMLVTHDHLET